MTFLNVINMTMIILNKMKHTVYRYLTENNKKDMLIIEINGRIFEIT